MGRKKIEKFTKMADKKQRKITIHKRKHALVKKMIELSMLGGVKVFMVMLDEEDHRATHYLSHKHYNVLDFFNTPFQREFFTNRDYDQVGGTAEELDSQGLESSCGTPTGSQLSQAMQ